METKEFVWHQNKYYVGGATFWSSNWLYNICKCTIISLEKIIISFCSLWKKNSLYLCFYHCCHPLATFYRILLSWNSMNKQHIENFNIKNVNKFHYLMFPPLSFDHHNIEINNINKPSLYTCLSIGEQLGYRLYGHRN